MKKVLFLIGMSLIHTVGMAHEANEAFFKISQRDSVIEIEATFPWSMRNALLTFNPSLETATNKRDFENTFIAYIKAKFILKDRNGVVLHYKEYKELENDGHSHQNRYLIMFIGIDLQEVTNTILFNVYENQVNYHTITINTEQETFKTYKAVPSFRLGKEIITSSWYLWFLLVPVCYIIYRMKDNS